MKMSCNGCRILRKGCSQDCTIRPCLQWLKNPQFQSNATFFLAKFYGRAGLINLINSGPENLRPAIFRSLLYEACGRIVDPVYGSAGLLCSGSWQLCQAAVEAVLKGAPIMQISSGEGGSSGPTMMNLCDIRHVVREERSGPQEVVHKIKTRSRFKRSGFPNQKLDSVAEFGWVGGPDSGGRFEPVESRDTESMFSVETEEDGVEPDSRADEGEVELELRLGFEPGSHAGRVQRAGHVKGMREEESWGGDTCNVELGLELQP
ncbi:LOB domain-containing protein 40-like [Magnolia sinica]|uniref:LOB domain-containing protein 40-like n=1 Tax=Magnolia sinica TaxID=86752 RepID=UPI0026581DEE|nr:LOB domain-containing protein 40-like [Magnolia sinica]